MEEEAEALPEEAEEEVETPEEEEVETLEEEEALKEAQPDRQHCQNQHPNLSQAHLHQLPRLLQPRLRKTLKLPLPSPASPPDCPGAASQLPAQPPSL